MEMTITKGISGVIIKQLVRHSDDRGHLIEIYKERYFFASVPVVKQTNYTVTYPGVIKAFHGHDHQWDLWHVISGEAQVVLRDMRGQVKELIGPCNRPGRDMVIYTGESNPYIIAIPPGVFHGYRVLGDKPVGLLYHVTQEYDEANPDELRLPAETFDWSTRNR